MMKKLSAGVIVGNVDNAQISTASGLPQGFASTVTSRTIFQSILHHVFHFVFFNAVL